MNAKEYLTKRIEDSAMMAVALRKILASEGFDSRLLLSVGQYEITAEIQDDRLYLSHGEDKKVIYYQSIPVDKLAEKVRQKLVFIIDNMTII